jgi:hypothetical protein
MGCLAYCGARLFGSRITQLARCCYGVDADERVERAWIEGIPSSLCLFPLTVICTRCDHPMRLLSRRGIIGVSASIAFSRAAHALEGAVDIYFVPGGRIGFKRPTDVKPGNKTWRLLSLDQTLRVEVRESLRIDADWDARFWNPERKVLVASGSHSPGIEYRQFRDTRYEGSLDYSSETYALRDERWIGQIEVSTGTLGSPFSVSGGQIARWRPVINALFSSITVRPTLQVSQALAEHGVRLIADSYNPRLAGDALIFSVTPPTNAEETCGVIGSRVLVPELSMRRAQDADQIDMAFDIYRRMPGSRVISGAFCRGVVRAESTLDDSGDPTFASDLMAFARTRQLKFQAFYNSADRTQILQALEQVFCSLSLPDIS